VLHELSSTIALIYCLQNCNTGKGDKQEEGWCFRLIVISFNQQHVDKDHFSAGAFGAADAMRRKVLLRGTLLHFKFYS